VALCVGWMALSGMGCSEADRPTPPAAQAPEKAGSAPVPPPQAAAPARSPEASPEALVARGRSVYLANCTACHNMDPAQPGSLGPDVKGASRALLEARVLHAAYPPGYTPKRDSKLMIALPFLEPELDALFAYLNQE